MPSPQGRDLRPPARDERRGRDRRARRGDRVRAGTTSSSRTTPTRTWSATRACGTRRSRRSGVIDACLGRVSDAVARVEAARPRRPGRRAARDRRPRQRRRHARRRRQPGHHALAQPGAAARDGPRRRRPRRSRDGVLADVAPTILELAGLPALGGDDRALAAGRGPDRVARGLCYHPAPSPPEVRSPVNPILAIGQILLSIALIAAILLQARGTGPLRHVRRRLGRLPQPPRRRAPPVAVHDRAAGAVRAVRAGGLRLRRLAAGPRGRLAVARDMPSTAATTRSSPSSSSPSSCSAASSRSRGRAEAPRAGAHARRRPLPPPADVPRGRRRRPGVDHARHGPHARRADARRASSSPASSGSAPATPTSPTSPSRGRPTTRATTWTFTDPRRRDLAGRRAGDRRRRRVHGRGAQEPRRVGRRGRRVGRRHRDARRRRRPSS